MGALLCRSLQVVECSLLYEGPIQVINIQGWVVPGFDIDCLRFYAVSKIFQLFNGDSAQIHVTWTIF